ncbi:polyadenylation/uridylation factor 1 [Perkinsela sp. CCAP 1560/4]|nr:polyadenylation/uridylation factor 1 [Perkinsela sp. CCAP 1560/4]|eukprot:KNH04076.1 polyadenylation/uridylation factor 1 [Perkinsela sp. CCAP 1560/4]
MQKFALKFSFLSGTNTRAVYRVARALCSQAGGERSTSASETKTSKQRSFQPFNRNDEEELVHSLSTKPRHVLRKVRQLVWKSRKRELQFRNTVTFLMITIQENLRKQTLEPPAASIIMEGIMEECVRLSQHDLAHLLFRAFLRFRKYGCKVTVECMRYLFESYKGTNSTELMNQLAVEMSGESELRPLCIAALLFSGKVKEAENLRKTIPDTQLTTSDIVAMIDGYERLKESSKLMILLSEVKALDTKQVEHQTIMKNFLRVFQKSSNHAGMEEVMKVLTELKIELDQGIFHILLRYKLREVAAVSEVQQIENELKEMGYDFDIQGNSILISAYARLINFGDRSSEEIMLGKVETLLSSIEARLKQGDPDLDVSVSHLRAVIRGFGAAGKQDQMKQAWERMQFKGLSNDTRVYNEMFKWLALMGSVRDVLKLKDHMKEHDVYPDSSTYAWIFKSLGKYYPNQVEDLYNEMVRNRVRPDLFLYTTMIGIFGDLQKMTIVNKILEEIHARQKTGTLQDSPYIYSILIRLNCDDHDRVEKIYAEAELKGFGDHPHVVTVYLHCLSKNGFVERMEELLKRMPTWSTNIYNVLLAFHGKKNDYEKVYKLLDKMKVENVEFNEVTYGTLITIFGHWKDSQRVLDVLNWMKSSGNPHISANFYSILASTYSRLGDTEGISEAWEDLISSRLCPDTEVYNTFLSLYGKQNNVAKMQHVLESMLKHVPPNPLTSSTVVDMLGKAGKICDMEQLVAEMKAHPEMSPTAVTYHQIMNAYAKTGDILKMERTKGEMMEKGYAENAVTFNILADGYGRAKRYEQLTELVDLRRKRGIPFEELGICVLVTAYARAKMTVEVHRVMTFFENDTAMIRKAEEIRSSTLEKACVLSEALSPKSSYSDKLLWTLIDAYCRCGDAIHMEKWVCELREKHGGALRCSDMSSLIAYYGRISAIDKMEEMAARIKEEKGEVSLPALNSMSKTYAKAGQFEKTVQVLHQLRDMNQVPDASTCLMLSGMFIKAGLHEQAQQIVQWRKQYVESYRDRSQ